MNYHKSDARSAAEVFERAVKAERAAIELHEGAARRLNAAADLLERRAGKEFDQLARKRILDRVSDARTSARRALHRAESARDRLRSEGVDPDDLTPPTPHT